MDVVVADAIDHLEKQQQQHSLADMELFRTWACYMLLCRSLVVWVTSSKTFSVGRWATDQLTCVFETVRVLFAVFVALPRVFCLWNPRCRAFGFEVQAQRYLLSLPAEMLENVIWTLFWCSAFPLHTKDCDSMRVGIDK